MIKTMVNDHNNRKFWEELVAYSSLMRNGLHRK
jgi:hypothetical protein